jgi:Bifunctional DNA primase/polymerase, N-terminal
VMRGDVLGQAFAYAALGWPVFPCKPGRKVPNTEHGFLDATTSLARSSSPPLDTNHDPWVLRASVIICRAGLASAQELSFRYQALIFTPAECG